MKKNDFADIDAKGVYECAVKKVGSGKAKQNNPLRKVLCDCL